MSVTIKPDKILREASSIEEKIDVDSNTVQGCIDQLILKVPESKEKLFDKKGRLMIMILLNGKIIYQKDLQKEVNDGDLIQLITAISGG